MKNLATILFVMSLLTTAALAGDVDDVKAVVQNYYAALNSGNMDAWSRNFQAGHTAFGGGGTFLEETTSLQEQRANRQAALDAGVRYNLQPLHNDVRGYGNLTAIATRYGVGTITQADGTTRQVNNRITDVWVKQGEQWKVVHRHVSPLLIARRPTPQESRLREAEEAARAAMEGFFRAFNATDNDALQEFIHYPHIVTSVDNSIGTWEQGLTVDFDALRDQQGWDHSTLDSAEAVLVREDKVHFKFVFSRHKADGTTYLTRPGLYAVTKQDGKWGISLRSY